MRQMHDMIELLTGWADDVQKLDNGSLKQLLALGAGVSRILELKGKVTLFQGRDKSGTFQSRDDPPAFQDRDGPPTAEDGVA